MPVSRVSYEASQITRVPSFRLGEFPLGLPFALESPLPFCWAGFLIFWIPDVPLPWLPLSF